MRWIETEGGPWIVAPTRSIGVWSGYHGHYEFACAVVENGRAGVVELPGGQDVVVIPSEEFPATYLGESGVIAQCTNTAPGQHATRRLIDMLFEVNWVEHARFRGGGPSVLCAAAVPGEELAEYEHLSLTVPTARCAIYSAEVAVGQVGDYWLHKIAVIGP